MRNSKFNERCWSVDFLQSPLTSGVDFRTIIIADHHHQEILAIECNEDISALTFVGLLGKIAATRGYPMKLMFDSSMMLISQELSDWTNEHGVQLEHIGFTKVSYLERFLLTYQTNVLNYYQFRTLNEVREITARWLNDYNSRQFMGH